MAYFLGVIYQKMAFLIMTAAKIAGYETDYCLDRAESCARY